MRNIIGIFLYCVVLSTVAMVLTIAIEVAMAEHGNEKAKQFVCSQEYLNGVYFCKQEKE